MAERLKEKLQENAPDVDIVIGNFQKDQLVAICNKAVLSASGIKETKVEPDFKHNHNKSFQSDINEFENRQNFRNLYTGKGSYSFYSLHENNDFKAFVPIMHGCNNYCSYCIVPYVRGPEISRPPSEILKELSRLERQHVKEITLLGQNVNSYNYQNIDFTGILRMILYKVQNIKWIRFLTSHPKDFPYKLIKVISESPLLCNHIHLPIQHGSDRILKKMNRGYTAAGYMNLVESIKKRISDVAITSDILIGFPGETEEDFRVTLNIMREIEFDDAFMYRYSVREGTKASTFKDDVPESIKLKRLAKVIELQHEISRNKRKKKINRVVNVLVERVSKKEEDELLGRTEYDEMVVFPGDTSKINTFVQVKLESLQGNTFKGRKIKCHGD